MADTDIELEGVELGDRPERVNIHLRAQNDVVLRLGGDDNRPGRAKKDGRSVFGEVDVIVVLDTDRRAEAELDRAHLQIVRDLVDRLTARFRSRFTRERWPDCVLRVHNSSGKKQRNEKNIDESAGEQR